MRELHVCFVGIGSIATRHIRNLLAICSAKDVSIIIDAIRHNGGEIPIDLPIRTTYRHASELTMTYDIVFITNPTSMHLDAIREMLPYARSFFVEKPLCSVNQIEAASQLLDLVKIPGYVACPLRYNSVIQYIKNNGLVNNAISVRSISSSYLPDWRPNVDYRQTYSAHQGLGGGVEIDLIHEWDYLSYLLGFPTTLHAMIGRKSKLEIDSHDYAIYIAEYPKCVVELHLDYFGQKTIREIQLITDNDTIVGDIQNQRILFSKSGEVIDFNENRDDYQIRELKHFLRFIEGKEDSDNDLQHAIAVLKLTQGEIEK